MFHLSPSQSLCNLTKSGFIYLLGYLFYLLKHELERNCAKMQREGDWAWVQPNSSFISSLKCSVNNQTQVVIFGYPNLLRFGCDHKMDKLSLSCTFSQLIKSLTNEHNLFSYGLNLIFIYSLIFPRCILFSPRLLGSQEKSILVLCDR